MPIYTEMIKDKKTGKMVPKLVDGQKQHFIRTYVTDENGNSKQVTRHNKEWLGRDGYNLAHQEEIRLKTISNVKNYNLSMEELIIEYLNFIKPTIKLRSFKKKEDNFRLHILPYFKKRKVNSLTVKDIVKWKNIMNTSTYLKGGKEHNYSFAYKQDIYVDLKMMIQYCVDVYGLPKNVVMIAKGFTQREEEKKEKEILLEEEFLKALEYETKEDYRDIFLFFFYSGLRIGELCGLKVKSIDIENMYINLKTTLWQSSPDEDNKETKPKTHSSIRKVPILPQLIPVIKKRIEINNIMGKKKNDYFFGNFRYIAESTIRRRLKIMLKKANINKEITPHLFRHSFITMCAYRGVPVDIVSKIVGHKNITTTYNIYTHVENKRIFSVTNYFS